MINFEHVSKKFGEITALEEVSFKIDNGEFVFLTGSSGAGKTTLIKLILGEYLPSGGEIEVAGVKVNKIARRKLYLWRRKLGVIFQDYKLLPNQTIFENVSLPLRFRKLSPVDIGEKTERALGLVGLKERMALFPAQLAGGELQRACLARAIVAAPEILLADEPTGNLDPTTASEMIKLLKSVNEKGTTVLMATHNKEIVDTLKTRVIELNKGKVVRDEKEGKYHNQNQKSNIKNQN